MKSITLRQIWLCLFSFSFLSRKNYEFILLTAIFLMSSKTSFKLFVFFWPILGYSLYIVIMLCSLFFLTNWNSLVRIISISLLSYKFGWFAISSPKISLVLLPFILHYFISSFPKFTPYSSTTSLKNFYNKTLTLSLGLICKVMINLLPGRLKWNENYFYLSKVSSIPI